MFNTTSDCSIAIRRTYSKMCVPCFSFGMLAVAIYRFSLGHSLESHCNRPIGGFQVMERSSCRFDISSSISCLNSLTTPADLSMTPQVTGRLGIACIKEPTNRARPAKTLACCTLKGVGLPAMDMLNGWERLEKNINGCVPLLLEPN